MTASTLSNAVELANAGWNVTLGSGSAIYTTDTGASSGNAVSATLDGVKITLNGTLNVVAGSVITFQNEAQFVAANDASKMMLNEGSELIIKDSNILMQVEKDDLAEVKVSAKTSTYENPTGPVAVGYMREAKLVGDINGATASVYGKLIISSGSKLSAGSVMNVYMGGSLVVDGDFTVDGKVNFYAGSVGKINGTMTIGGSNGGAEVTSTSADITVGENGTVKISAINNKATKDNKLTVTGSYMPTYSNGVVTANAGKAFIVEGILDVRGTLAADMILDKGTVTMNGTSAGSTIVLFDGVSFTATSVKGTLTVTDANINDDLARDRVTVSGANTVTLDDVTGITVSEEVTNSTYSITNEGTTTNYRVYTANMYVSGTSGEAVKDLAGSVTVNTTASADANGKGAGKVEFADTYTVGKNTSLNLAGAKVVISGTVNCVAEDAAIAITAGKTTVTGTVTVKAGSDYATELSGDEYLDAAMYVVTDTTNGSQTYTYTNFENAMKAASTADDKTVTVLGKVITTEETVEIPAGIIVEIDGELEIAKKTTVTAVKGTNVSGVKITVKGEFTSEDYVNDLDVDEVKADVISTVEPKKTWTGIAAALEDAADGTVITINNNVELDSDITIGQGVTVQSEYNILIKKNTVLTVAGTLEVTKGTLGVEPASAPDVAGKLVVTGSAAVAVASDDTEKIDAFKNVSGAYYVKLVGAKYFQYVSNISIAAAAVDEKLQNNNTITISGEVTSEPVVFKKADKSDALTINIVAPEDSTKKTVVNVDIELVGAKMVVSTDATYSGNVTAASDGGKAVVGLTSVKGVTIDTHVDNSTSTPVDSMLIAASVSGTTNNAEGQIAIQSGKVTLGTENGGNIATGAIIADDKVTLSVGSDATLVVPTGGSIIVEQGQNADKASMTVDGTIDVTKGLVTISQNGILDVNGTMKVAESSNDKGIANSGTLNIVGTLDISAEDGKEGRVSNANIITVGSKPADLGAAGTVTGTINLGENGYVKVYDGTVGKVLTYTGIEAESVKVVLNGVDYMTVYAAAGEGLRDIIVADGIDLDGVDGFVNAGDAQTVIYSDAAMTKPISKSNTETINVGDYDAVYMKLETSTVLVKVSVGDGMTLWIDGIKYPTNAEGYNIAVGTHDVQVILSPGYSGSYSIVFNGKEITDGKLTLTTLMNGDNVLSVTGDISTGSTSSNDDGMSITDILLIVLVVLIVIMAVLVAIRMMRS